MRRREPPASRHLGETKASVHAFRYQRPHESLECWKEAVHPAVLGNEATQTLPAEVRCGLTSQPRRAAVSVPANITEGAAGRGDAERRQFILIARSSLSELETHLVIVERLGYLASETTAPLFALTGKIGAMPNGLLRRWGRVAHTALPDFLTS
ncbi:MAG: four helix bundle protein [Acidobacteriota bacterium]